MLLQNIEDEQLDLRDSVSEQSFRNFKKIASKNKVYSSLIGMGYYGTYTPNVILRNILENPGWYTAYTPYQPEVAQGRLEMLLNFQQMIRDLTKMDIANASLLDESTAAAEAVALCQRINKEDAKIVFVSKNCHPQTIEVIKTRAEPFGLHVLVGSFETLEKIKDNILCGIVSYPDTYGLVENIETHIKTIQSKKGKAIVVADLLALTLLKAPGEMGADIVVGNSQRFGVPMGYGGPHAAFFAAKDEYKRAMPGRIIGVSVDRKENQALRMALQTREQHIRRDKATSNICTAQALLSIMAAAYGIYHGPDGIKHIAERTNTFASMFAAEVSSKYKLVSETFFDTVCLDTGADTADILKRAYNYGVNFELVNEERISVAFDETTELKNINNLFEIFAVEVKVEGLDANVASSIPSELVRTSKFMQHEVFHQYHSETEMLRYLKRLEDKDIALNRSMIALGSCTMKLNAVAEMIPVTWKEFSQPHPFAPVDQAQGYQELFEDLKKMLSEIPGFSGISFGQMQELKVSMQV